MILYFRLPCLKNQQLSHTRASHRVWDWVTPHESVRKCQSQAQNQDPKLRRLARVARVDEPAQSMRLNERCTGLLLQPVKMWAKKKLCFSRASPPVAPPMPLLPRFGANRVNDTLCTHRNGPSKRIKTAVWRKPIHCPKPDIKIACNATRKSQRPYRKK